MNVEAQTFSHYPAWPSPVRFPLQVAPEHPCSYLPGRVAQMRWLAAGKVDPLVYERFMDAGFRRSGRMIYQPICRGCRSCIPIRVPVDRFKPNKSQRRCLRRNSDISVSIDEPIVTDEKYELYQRYVLAWHDHQPGETSREDFERFLYDSPVSTIEFSYRDQTGQLLAVGICDVTPSALSSVYFYFEPTVSRRSLGTYGALGEITHAQSMNLPRYYLGYWISGCSSMDYKSCFRPCHVLHTDGFWRDLDEESE